jgi:hypothetical protein
MDGSGPGCCAIVRPHALAASYQPLAISHMQSASDGHDA